MVFSECMPSSGIVGSYGSFIFSVLRNLHMILSTLFAPICSPTNSVHGFPFLHSHSNNYSSRLFWGWPFWMMWVDNPLWVACLQMFSPILRVVFLFSLWLPCFISITSKQKDPHIGYYHLQNNKNQIMDVINLKRYFMLVVVLWPSWESFRKEVPVTGGSNRESCPPRPGQVRPAAGVPPWLCTDKDRPPVAARNPWGGLTRCSQVMGPECSGAAHEDAPEPKKEPDLKPGRVSAPINQLYLYLQKWMCYEVFN